MKKLNFANPKNKAAISQAARALGSIGGSQNTPAQNAARAKNGKNGGRPPMKKGSDVNRNKTS